MVMEISASQFKARCLALLDEVAESGAELVVTKRGRPVARVGPVDPGASLVGSVSLLVDEDELIAPIDEHWDAEGGRELP
jgi:prevent-host-death family protein